MANNILNPWIWMGGPWRSNPQGSEISTSDRVQEFATSNASLSEIAGMLAPTEATTVDRSEFGSPASINKITWQKAGRVTEPGRYMLKFGWLTVTADDLAIWRQFPNAAFTLVRTANEAGEDYRLGTFELQENPHE
jgi:hypothetical protein